MKLTLEQIGRLQQEADAAEIAACDMVLRRHAAVARLRDREAQYEEAREDYQHTCEGYDDAAKVFADARMRFLRARLELSSSEFESKAEEPEPMCAGSSSSVNFPSSTITKRDVG